MELEVSNKVRAAIKAKLVELGVHVDEELPDYVMVLIANRRTKESVENDLQLFLNENTFKFSNWLFSVLKKLEEVTLNKLPPKEPVKPISYEPKSDPESRAKSPPKEKVKEVERVSSSTKRKSNDFEETQSSKSEKGSSKRAKIEEKVESRSKGERVEIRYNDPDQPVSSFKEKSKAFGDSRRGHRKISPSNSRRSNEEKSMEKSRSRSPVRRGFPLQSPPALISRRAHSPPRRFQMRKDIKDRLEERRRRVRSPRTRSRSPDEGRFARKSLKSLVSAIVRPKDQSNDEEYDPRRPAVNTPISSVVKVTQRPRRDSQANNKLVLLAMADAQKSIVTKSIQSKDIHTKMTEKKEESIKISFDVTMNKEASENPEYISLSSNMFKSTFKPSIKDRLGERRRRNDHEHGLEEGDDLEIELDAETYQKDVASKEDLQMIVVKVPSSSTSNNQRNVTLGELATTIKPISNPNSFKIQVNVSDDDSSSSDYGNDSEDETKEINEKIKSSTPIASNENSNDKKSSEEEEIIEEVLVETDDDGEAYEAMNDQDLEAERKRILRNRRSHKKPVEKNEKMEESDEEFVFIEDTNGIRLPEPPESERKSFEEKMDTKENKSHSFSSSVDDCTNSVDVSPEKINVIMNQPRMLPIPMTCSNSMLSPKSTKFVITMNEEEMDESILISHDERLGTSNDLRNRIQGIYSQQMDFLPNEVQLYRTIENNQGQIQRSFGTGIPPKVPPPSTGCKYWPNCTFKDKCAYPHPNCMYGVACTKRDCPYKHPAGIRSKPPPPPPVDEGKIVCKFFPKCHTMSCTFYHPTPCRFGIGCTDLKCSNYHPGKTVGQTRTKPTFTKGRGGTTFHKKPPAAHLLKWVAPSPTPTKP